MYLWGVSPIPAKNWKADTISKNKNIALKAVFLFIFP
jgi:hypothetical protein